MNKKGYFAFEKFIDEFGTDSVLYVVSHPDKSVDNDYYEDIKTLCNERGVKFSGKDDEYSLENAHTFVIGWRWMIRSNEKFYVLHDSILPEYRGFSPLVSCLLNGERSLGVTCILSEMEYDRGAIISRLKTRINYPIKISEAIDTLCPMYSSLVNSVYRALAAGKKLKGRKQDESKATYSVWRDEEDYHIDWNKSSRYIQRFVDAVGYPYRGAFSEIDGRVLRINDVEIRPDCKIENRSPGKVIFIDGGMPVVICGKGLVKITNAYYEDSNEALTQFKKFRVRFK